MVPFDRVDILPTRQLQVNPIIMLLTLPPEALPRRGGPILQGILHRHHHNLIILPPKRHLRDPIRILDAEGLSIIEPLEDAIELFIDC